MINTHSSTLVNMRIKIFRLFMVCNNVFIRMITRSFNDFIIELKLIESKTIFMESKIF
jgi:hypothetical protein